MFWKRVSKVGLLLVVTLGVWSVVEGASRGLEHEEILVLANKNAAGSVGLAKYYMEKRGIPKNNLLVLWVTDKEECSRKDYENKIVPLVRRYLKENDPERRIRCLLTMCGLPLKIAPPAVGQKEQREIEELSRKQGLLEERLKSITGNERERLEKELEEIKERVFLLKKIDERASFDSEIALVLMEEYSLSKWVLNPFFAGYHDLNLIEMRDRVLIVSRLDGPSEEIVRRIIDDSIATEKSGLRGKAYFDARWPMQQRESTEKNDFGYKFYDRSIHKAAALVKKSGRIPVVVNNTEELFQPGECPDSALYCGWYSLGKYVDAFEWKRGSIGYHIASAECTTLKRADSQVWCKRMLEEGVAATIGPVNEPYVQAFPVPEIFFELLVDGYWTLAECYALSTPFLSWQMVLIGDPLYRPFKEKN